MQTQVLFWLLVIYCIKKFRSGWYQKRTARIADFMDVVRNICEDYDEQHFTEISGGIKQSAFEWVFEKIPPIDRLIISPRRLRLESWLSEDEIGELLH